MGAGDELQEFSGAGDASASVAASDLVTASVVPRGPRAHECGVARVLPRAASGVVDPIPPHRLAASPGYLGDPRVSQKLLVAAIRWELYAARRG